MQIKGGKSNSRDSSAKKHIFDPNEIKSFKEIGAEIQSQRKLLQSARTKLEKIKEKIHSTQHQIEIHKCETQLVNEQIKDANWRFTKDICLQLAKIKKPAPDLVDVTAKFLILLERKEKTWHAFQDLSKNYNTLKGLMEAFNVDNMKEEIVEDLIPLWKHQTDILERVSGVSKGAAILLQWVVGCVEYRVKKLTLNDLKKTESELQARLKDRIASITQKNDLISSLEQKMKKYQEYEDSQVQQVEHDLANISHSTAFDSTNPVKESVARKKMPIDCNDGDIEDDVVSDETPINTQPICMKNYSFSVQNHKQFSSYSTDESKGSKHVSCDSYSEILEEPSMIQKIQNILKNHDSRNKDIVIKDSKILFQSEKPKLSGKKSNLKYSLATPILEESAEILDEKRQPSPVRTQIKAMNYK